MNVLERKELKCVCGGKAKETLLDYKGFKLRGWKCRKCGEEITDPRDFNAFMELKRKGRLIVKVGKLGNNLIFRIPKAVEELCNIKTGEKLTIYTKSRDKFEVTV